VRKTKGHGVKIRVGKTSDQRLELFANTTVQVHDGGVRNNVDTKFLVDSATYKPY
jgi:hypothetical protein